MVNLASLTPVTSLWYLFRCCLLLTHLHSSVVHFRSTPPLSDTPGHLTMVLWVGESLSSPYSLTNFCLLYFFSSCVCLFMCVYTRLNTFVSVEMPMCFCLDCFWMSLCPCSCLPMRWRMFVFLYSFVFICIFMCVCLFVPVFVYMCIIICISAHLCLFTCMCVNRKQ